MKLEGSVATSNAYLTAQCPSITHIKNSKIPHFLIFHPYQAFLLLKVMRTVHEKSTAENALLVVILKLSKLVSTLSTDL